jgi:Zn-dependent peptidase ImmA (M78 family)
MATPVGERIKKKYRRKSPREIVGLTRLILRLITSTSNILIAFEELRRIFPKLRFVVVPDDDLPNDEAYAYPRYWLIKIRQSIYEGLLRGRNRGRWTLAHEVGHVLLRHPRRPRRSRDPKTVRPVDRVYEAEANLFAAALLAPYERAVVCADAREIKTKFRISLEAAETRFNEIADEIGRARFALKIGLPPNKFAIETGHPVQIEEQLQVACRAILATISEAKSTIRSPLGAISENLFGAATLVAAASHLLLGAYETVSRVTASHDYKFAAALAYAILTIKPVRPISGGDLSENEIFVLNQRCALRAATAMLKIPWDVQLLKGSLCSDHPAVQFFKSSYLDALMRAFESQIVDSNAILSLSDFPKYETYNHDNDINWGDIHEMEYLMNLLMLLVADTPESVGVA